MPRPRNHVPTYRIHKQSGQAIVTVSVNGKRRDVLSGKYGTPESRSEYQRVLAELNSSGAARGPAYTARMDMTINELLVPFMAWATGHYPTAEDARRVRCANSRFRSRR